MTITKDGKQINDFLLAKTYLNFLDTKTKQEALDTIDLLKEMVDLTWDIVDIPCQKKKSQKTI